MSKEQLFIPSKCRVGFQHRKGTYGGRLAYVIYYDAKNKLRKEASWNSWRYKEDGSHQYNNRDKFVNEPSVTPYDFDNVPTSGFVLNKGVGGVRESWGWNPRNEYIRVWDPRGIEFEITLPNLIFILMHTDCVKRQLQGDFVYSWDSKNLVLLPVSAEEYKKSVEYTALQGKKIGARDLKEGYIYETKKQKKLVFLGRFDFHYVKYRTYYSDDPTEYVTEKRRIFIDPDTRSLVHTKNLSFLAKEVGGPVPNYAELLEVYKNHPWSSKATHMTVHWKEDCLDSLLKEKSGWYDPVIDLYRPGITGTGYDGVRVIGDYRKGEDVPFRYAIYLESYLRFKWEDGEFESSSPRYRNPWDWHYADAIRDRHLIAKDLTFDEAKKKLEAMGAGKLYWVNENGGEMEFKSFRDLTA